MRQILFFALKDDLALILDAVEKNGALQYVPMGQFTDGTPEVLARGRDIESLGVATANSSTASESFLVAEPKMPIRPRVISPAPV